MEKTRRALRLLTLALLLGACLWIAWRVPYAHDDWEWGQSKGVTWWLTCAVNNRWFGSFFAVIMGHSPWVKMLVMGLTMFSLPLLAAEIAAFDRKEHHFFLTLLGCAALMIMPLLSWQQTYGWVSAFANFVMGGLWLLMVIWLLRLDLAQRGGGKLPFLLFPLAVSAQLFAENITVCLAAGAVCFALWAWRSGRSRAAAGALLAGSLVGLVLMFCNPLYGDLLSSGSAVSGVRRLAVPLDSGPAAFFLTLFQRFFTVVLPDLFEDFPALWALACTGGMWRALKARRPWVLVLPAAAFSGFFLWCCWLKMNYGRQGIPWSYPLPALRAAGPCVICALLALVILSGPRRSYILPRFALLAMAIALSAPFAALEDHGARCCFPSAVILLVLGLSLLDDLSPALPLTWGAAALLTAAVVFHMQAYWVIGNCTALRDQLLQEALEQNSSSVVLPLEDWRYFYTWERNPHSAARARNFRDFYGLPDEMELVFLRPGSFDVWPDITPEMIYYAAVY